MRLGDGGQRAVSTAVVAALLATVACELGAVPVEDGGGLCGNGVLDPGEDCDLRHLEGGKPVPGPLYRIQSCHKGTLSCTADCSVPETACLEYCGDGVVNGPEQCDGVDFRTSCQQGTFVCNADCTLDSSGCSAWCGDGVVTEPEKCEPSVKLPDNACYDGTAACTAECAFDLLTCNAFCGDEIRNGPEACDGPDIPGRCHDDGGVLSCTTSCQINPNGCATYCGDGKKNGDEECDGADYPAKPCAAATCDLDCTVNDTACP